MKRAARAYRACARYKAIWRQIQATRQDRSRMATHCPMFTERHIHHSAVWLIEGFSVSSFCLACATERLEHKSIVPLHCRQVLNEFQALLSAQNKPLIHILSSDRRVLDHFSTLVFGMFKYTVLHVKYKCLYTQGSLFANGSVVLCYLEVSDNCAI